MKSNKRGREKRAGTVACPYEKTRGKRKNNEHRTLNIEC
jgi:hypothetical protein